MKKISECIKFIPSVLSKVILDWNETVQHFTIVNIFKMFNIYDHPLARSELFLLLASKFQKIRWGNSCPTKFVVANEVKQGGILSPSLFNVYMNNLSLSLNHFGIGGLLEISLINQLCYADDLCT